MNVSQSYVYIVVLVLITFFSIILCTNDFQRVTLGNLEFISHIIRSNTPCGQFQCYLEPSPLCIIRLDHKTSFTISLPLSMRCALCKCIVNTVSLFTTKQSHHPVGQSGRRISGLCTLSSLIAYTQTKQTEKYTHRHNHAPHHYLVRPVACLPFDVFARTYSCLTVVFHCNMYLILRWRLHCKMRRGFNP